MDRFCCFLCTPKLGVRLKFDVDIKTSAVDVKNNARTARMVVVILQLSSV